MLPSFAFLVAALILAVTPGPGIAYVVARTAAGGRAEGLASCVGTTLGGMLHVGAAALRLSVLLARSAAALVVKYLGAAYLVYLGSRLLLSKAAPRPLHASSTGPRRALLEGVLVEALNVKTALFFLAFLPQFLASCLEGPSAAGLPPFVARAGAFAVVFAHFVAGPLLLPARSLGMPRTRSLTGCAARRRCAA
jgi:threonine/homoserine/homoserine lactone efflux protein